jgi:phage head maturation protease
MRANISRFLTIEKRDDEQHIVEGYASSEDIDLQGGVWPPDNKDGSKPRNQVYYEGDVVQAAAIEKALPDYMQYANLREMHDESAVGTILKAEVIKGEIDLPDGRKIHNPLHIVAHIVDPLAWEKVITGVYKGFSIKADVFKLSIAKVAGKVVRLIEEILMKEISLVDRPAAPGAQVILWKGLNMDNPEVETSQEEVTKAADHLPAVEALQSLRNACETAGDLAKAAQYTNAIALVMQANGAEMAVEAEDIEEAEEEHAALGEPSPVEENQEDTEPATEEEKQAALAGLESEQPVEEDDAAKKATVAKGKKTVVAKRAPVDVVSKAELTTLQGRIEEIAKAFGGDIARMAVAFEDLTAQVENLKQKPVLRELPWGGPVAAAQNQPVEILKGLLEDPRMDEGSRQILSQQIAALEIREATPNYIGYGKR